MKLIKRFLIMTKRHWSSLFLAVFGIIGAALLNLVTPDIVRRLTASLSVDGNACPSCGGPIRRPFTSPQPHHVVAHFTKSNP